MIMNPKMAKISSLLCLIVVLLFGSITARAARINPGLAEATATTQLKGVDQYGHGSGVLDDEGCQGISEEDCMVRRTLAAHADYIYTQSQKHKP